MRVNRAEYKRSLAKAGVIRCDRCPYHRGENAGRRPKPEKVKRGRRAARKMKERGNHDFPV